MDRQLAREQETAGAGAEVAPATGDASAENEAAIEAEFQEAKRTIIHACEGAGTWEDVIYDTIAGCRAEVKERLAKDEQVQYWLKHDLSRSELAEANRLLGTSLTHEQRVFQSELGQASTFFEVAGAVGGFLETFAPNSGDMFEGSLGIELKCAVLTLKLTFSLQGERTPAGFETQVSLGFWVGVVAKGFGCKVEVGASVTLGAAGKGDSGPEAVRLIGLGMRDSLSEWLGVGACDAVFGEGYEEAVLADMDARVPHPGPPPGPDATEEELAAYDEALRAFLEADTVTMSTRIGANAKGTAEAGGAKVAGEVSGGLTSEREIGKGEDGQVEAEDTDFVDFGGGFEVCGAGFSLGARVALGETQQSSVDLKGSAKLPFSPEASVLLNGFMDVRNGLVAGIHGLADIPPEAVSMTRSLASIVTAADFTKAQAAVAPNVSGEIEFQLIARIVRIGHEIVARNVDLVITNTIEQNEIDLGVTEASVSMKTGMRIPLL
ncbi:MAG: hypothetical protein KC656_00640 [Myxococcales bacterium]|nr:hypothetical protein [Myxococcales bacterium]MCB9692222.1 hypothetical protein [Alphaproteobacteria bacterium]